MFSTATMFSFAIKICVHSGKNFHCFFYAYLSQLTTYVKANRCTYVEESFCLIVTAFTKKVKKGKPHGVQHIEVFSQNGWEKRNSLPRLPRLASHVG